jgi:hypothetical protein
MGGEAPRSSVPWRGIRLLSGAPQIPAQLGIHTLPQSPPDRLALLSPLGLCYAH